MGWVILPDGSMAYVERGFVPGYSADLTEKLIVEYERNWVTTKAESLLQEWIDAVREEPSSLVLRGDGEADFEYYPEMNDGPDE